MTGGGYSFNRKKIRMYTYGVYGESTSTGHKATLQAGITAGTAWCVTTSTPTLVRKGGFAASGYNSYEVYSNAVRTDPTLAFWMERTNDMSQNISLYKSKMYMMKTFDVVSPDIPVALAIPPMVGVEQEVNDYNAWLAEVAHIEGLEFFDPWVTFKDGAGFWLPGSSKTDGRHPTDATSMSLGVVIRDFALSILPAN